MALDREEINAEPITTIDDVIEKKEVECVVQKTCDNDCQNEEDELDAVLRNTHYDERDTHDDEEERQQPVRNPSIEASLAGVDSEVRQCPVCNWDFPATMNVDGKRDHIERHFA